MYKKLFSDYHYLPEYVLFCFAFFTRFFRLSHPPNYIFDEVYYAFTSREMLHGNQAAWEWWNTPPEGVAYEWTHPYLAKEFMVLGMKLFGENSFGWRFFPALFGTAVIILVYFVAYKLFHNRLIALFAAGIAALDGLLLVTSRIAMTDSTFAFFALIAILTFLYKKPLVTGIALGMAVATKWTGFYAIAVVGILTLLQWIQQFKNRELRLTQFARQTVTVAFCYLAIPAAIYLASYLPLFLTDHVIPAATETSRWDTFVGLQKQMWWYHTGLNATHSYQSRPWQWILDARPVWFYVDYKDKTIANVYALGNPLALWFGFIAVLFLIWEYIRTRSLKFAVIIVSYFGFFLPWQFSPRIMFFYHYTPAVPFLAIASAYVLHKFLKEQYGRQFMFIYFFLLTLTFLWLFPLWTGIHVPKEFAESYFVIKSWK